MIERAVSVTAEKIEAAWNHSGIASLEAEVAGLKTQLENLLTGNYWRPPEIQSTERKINALEEEIDSLKETFEYLYNQENNCCNCSVM